MKILYILHMVYVYWTIAVCVLVKLWVKFLLRMSILSCCSSQTITEGWMLY